jgi:hypothetical protein
MKKTFYDKLPAKIKIKGKVLTKKPYIPPAPKKKYFKKAYA